MEDSSVIDILDAGEKSALPVPMPEEVKDRERFSSYILEKIKKCGKKRAAIFSHAQPDLDAIGSQMGVQYLLETAFDIETDLYVDGDVSHPQNKIAAQLLDPDLISVSKYKEDLYFLNILVDTVPNNAGVGSNNVHFDIIIDHHKDVPDDDDSLIIHYHSGSCAGLVNELIRSFNLDWDIEKESHVKIATAIWSGVITDTGFCTKPDTTNRDFLAEQSMSKIADAAMVRKIVRFKWPMTWVKLLGRAITDHEMHDGIAVVGLGQLESDQYHAVAAIADQMLSWGNIHTAVAFAFFDGKYVSGCLRTSDDTVEVSQLCAKLGGEHGHGGGKDFAGRYTKSLAAFEFEIDEPNDILERWWELQREREIKKIVKILSK